MSRPASSPSAFRYEECDIAPGQTLAEWRRANGGRRHRRRGVGAALSGLARRSRLRLAGSGQS